MITLKNISLEFLNQKIFNNLTQAFSLEDRVGIVGPNGAGKSTLLKVISGLQKPDSGSVLLGNNKIAYLPQEFVLNSNKAVIDEAFSGHHSGSLFLKEKELQEKLKNQESQELAEELLNVSNELSNYDVTKDLQETKKILMGLGFSQKQLNQKVNELSVGWQMRLILGKLLMQKADFYLFDEPTNHLDITTKEWFLNFLKNSNIGFLLISHERYFLNKLCEKTLALQNGQAKMYAGNYDFYERAKKEEIESLHQQKIVQEKEIARKQETINRFRASASKAKMAQKMIKDLAKIEPIELPPENKIIRLSFDDIKKSNKHVLNVKNLSFGYEKDNTLFKNVTFEVERGQKIAIVAPNGKGKTTLFKVLTQKLKPDNGSITFDEKATYSIFEQDEHGSLSMNNSVFEEVNDSTSQPYEKVRSYLGAFLFDDESMKKKIKVLSGGEKNRVKLVKLLLQNTNLLLLDEPTNHLDIPSKDVLMSALQDFPGTILFVSHDRDFINKVATHVIDLKENSGHMYKGNYDEFLDQINEIGLNSEDKTNNQSFKNKTKSSHQDKNIKKEINKIEREISSIESKIKSLNSRFIELEYGTKEFDDAMQKLQGYEKELEDLTQQWEEKVIL